VTSSGIPGASNQRCSGDAPRPSTGPFSRSESRRTSTADSRRIGAEGALEVPRAAHAGRRSRDRRVVLGSLLRRALSRARLVVFAYRHPTARSVPLDAGADPDRVERLLSRVRPLAPTTKRLPPLGGGRYREGLVPGRPGAGRHHDVLLQGLRLFTYRHRLVLAPVHRSRVVLARGLSRGASIRPAP